MTNPAASMRILIAYAIIIPLAIIVGYLLANPLDYSTLGFFGILVALLVSPIFIKWYYPILIFGLGCPAVCFFLPGRPPMSQVVVLIALGVAITERIMNSEKRFIHAPVMMWPLLYLAAMIFMTAELNGGIGLHTVGGGQGGGRKYIEVFIGIGTFFAITSQVIPRNRWKWYLILSMFPPLLGLITQLFPFLPSPLNYINLLFPPLGVSDEEIIVGQTRLVPLSYAVGTVVVYMLARYGLRGIFLHHHPGRALIFVAAFLMTMLGGYRNTFAGTLLTMGLMFYFDRLYRTRLMPVMVLVSILGVALLAVFSDRLPYTFQRSMSFLPLKWKTEVMIDADGSSEWRFRMWRATWPKVPENLLVGKGFTINKEDFDMIGPGTFANAAASHVDASDEALALSGDYHSGPLSTLMGFGVWGAIGIFWLMGATFFVVYRNYRYGDLEMRTYNIYMLASCISSIIAFFFIFGAFNNAMAGYGSIAGMSLAMNGGLAKKPAKTGFNPPIKPLKSSPAASPSPA